MKDIITHTIHNLLTEAVWGKTREATKRDIETYANRTKEIRLYQ